MEPPSSTQWIYDRTLDNKARFTLAPPSANPLLCFGINPSTASPERLDNTVQSVARIAQRHAFDGFMMLNVYPQRATDPNNLHATRDQALHAQNLFWIEQYFQKSAHKNILAAWGTLIHKRPYLRECLQDIYELSLRYDCTWHCIGKRSKDGHPHHPLYLSNQEMMYTFDLAAYIKTLP